MVPPAARRGHGGLRRLARLLAWLAASVALALALGVLVPRPLWPGTAPDGPTTRILVLSGPIHTDVALPLDAATRETFAFLADAGVPVDHPGAAWLVLGWGGRAFYLGTPTWGDLRPGPVLRSLGRDASVIHADVAGPIAVPQKGVVALDLGEADREAMTAAILASFAGLDAIEGAGYGATDRFFEAHGGFNLLAGCNTWTGAMLRAGGLRTGWWTPLPSMLTASLRLHAAD